MRVSDSDALRDMSSKGNFPELRDNESKSTIANHGHGNGGKRRISEQRANPNVANLTIDRNRGGQGRVDIDQGQVKEGRRNEPNVFCLVIDGLLELMNVEVGFNPLATLGVPFKVLVGAQSKAQQATGESGVSNDDGSGLQRGEGHDFLVFLGRLAGFFPCGWMIL